MFRFLKNYLIVSQKRGVSVKKVLLFCIPGFVTIFHVLSKSPLKILTRTGDKLHPWLIPWFTGISPEILPPISICMLLFLLTEATENNWATSKIIAKFGAVSLPHLEYESRVSLADTRRSVNFNDIFKLRSWALLRQRKSHERIFWNNINNFQTRCNTKQSIYYSASPLYMFRVSTTPIIQRGQAWPRWREVASQKVWPVPEAVVTVLCTPDD